MLNWFYRRGRSIPGPATDGNREPIRRTGDGDVITAGVLPGSTRPAAASEQAQAGDLRDSASSGVLKAIAG